MTYAATRGLDTLVGNLHSEVGRRIVTAGPPNVPTFRPETDDTSDCETPWWVDQMDPQFAIANLEDGMPTVPQVMARLSAELQTAQRRKLKVLKLIHGYGSSGVGGDLRISIQSKLRQMLEHG